MTSPATVSTRITRRQLERELRAVADSERAASSKRFFKTGKGQYGEGDRFLGISVPVQRKIAQRYRALSFDDIARLLASPIHEFRLTALEILVAQYRRGDENVRARIFEFYLTQTSRINNWDLVDASAPSIVGAHVKTQPRAVLDQLVVSSNVWERRIAIVATLALIKEGQLEDTFRLAHTLLSDKHDLIHKAVGWALRETGKVSQTALLRFLSAHHAAMPRTALRYAIERFPLTQRRKMLTGDFKRSRPR